MMSIAKKQKQLELCSYNKKNSLHMLGPYIGKFNTNVAHTLITDYASKNTPIFDPFSGSGTVLLEGWRLGYSTIGTDLNLYAYALSKGKTNPPQCTDIAAELLAKYNADVQKEMELNSRTATPEWIGGFFHEKTLKEINNWMQLLIRKEEWFFISCLLGILHHQRPGFLSYPASHNAPYLRENKYPRDEFPEMYEYRGVYERLTKKVFRCMKDVGELDFSLSREMYIGDASMININTKSCTIITSPPYMKSLTYARDNRMRLWFLGVEDWKSLDSKISPSSSNFIEMMKRSFENWSNFQSSGDKCVLVMGKMNISVNKKRNSMEDFISSISQSHYKLIGFENIEIPTKSRVIKTNKGIESEQVIILERK